MNNAVIDETYRNRLFLYLNSFDQYVERDLLEVDIYDQEYQKECYKKFCELVKEFYEKCKSENRTDVWFRYPSDWFVVKCKTYISEMIKLYGSLESIPDNIQDPIRAFYKFGTDNVMCNDFNFEEVKLEEFGKVIGRSTDRYDYFMYLKYGLTYEPKYITKEELYKILKYNKYGFSAHCIF